MNISEAETLLDLDGNYTLKDVKTARRLLAKRYHPDANDNSEASKVLMQQINEACDLLTRHLEQMQGRKRRGTQPATQPSRQDSPGEGKDSHQARWSEAVEEEYEHRAAENRARERERVYQKACDLAQDAETAADHAKVAALFRHLGVFRDSAERCAHHQAVAEEKRAAERKEAAERDARAKKLNTPSAVLIAAAAIAFLAGMYINFGPSGLGICLFFGGWLPPGLAVGSAASMHKRNSDISNGGFVGGVGLGFGIAAVATALFLNPEGPGLLLFATAQCAAGVSSIIGVDGKPKSALKIAFACLACALLVGGIYLLMPR